MSYTNGIMLHHIQKAIIHTLVENDSVRFAELKPTHIDGNVFTYHLKQLARDGYIKKSEEGAYVLTSAGKRLGINRNLTQSDIANQAHSIFLIAGRNNEGAWLLRKRLVHPARGLIGFIHGEPEYNKPLLKSAHERLLAKTGLTADLQVISQGFIRIFTKTELESFTHVTLLQATNISGALRESDSTGENFWAHEPNFSDRMMLPSMPILTKIVTEPGSTPFFDETYTLLS